MKKTTKTKQATINNALLASLGSHTSDLVPKPSKTNEMPEKKAPLKPIFNKKSPSIQQAKKPYNSHQTRHSLLLTPKDHEAIRQTKIMFLNAGHDTINISRILKMGLRLLPKSEQILFDAYKDILAEDARVKSSSLK